MEARAPNPTCGLGAYLSRSATPTRRTLYRPDLREVRRVPIWSSSVDVRGARLSLLSGLKCGRLVDGAPDSLDSTAVRGSCEEPTAVGFANDICCVSVIALGHILVLSLRSVCATSCKYKVVTDEMDDPRVHLSNVVCFRVGATFILPLVYYTRPPAAIDAGRWVRGESNSQPTG